MRREKDFTMIKKLLFKWLLPKALKLCCESTIPRSGEEGARVNCYSVSIENSGSPYFLINKYGNNKLSGLRWSGRAYEIEDEISDDELLKKQIRIRHYYGLSTIEFDSIYDFFFNYFAKTVYVKIHIQRIKEKYLQNSFNKKKLITKQRIDLLRFMLDDQLDRTHNGIDTIDLMTKIHTLRWVLHPSRDYEARKVELYLDSLVATGDLEKINSEYVVQGQALSTIEKYEEEERRHSEAVILQKKMVSLTIILAFLALVQSGIIKLPVLMDFTNNPEPVQSTHKSGKSWSFSSSPHTTRLADPHRAVHRGW